jgi:hypothetical protein
MSGIRVYLGGCWWSIKLSLYTVYRNRDVNVEIKWGIEDEGVGGCPHWYTCFVPTGMKTSIL